MAKHQKLNKAKTEGEIPDSTIFKNISLSKQNLMLSSESLDKQRFTKIDVEWLKKNQSNEEASNLYYSSMLTTAPNITKSQSISKDLISFPVNSSDPRINPNNLENIPGYMLYKGSSITKSNPKVAFSNIYNTNKYKYIVTSGNNSKLIREAMKQRNWWVEIPNVDSVFNFKWQPVSHRMKFRDLNESNPNKQIVNHFEYHR